MGSVIYTISRVFALMGKIFKFSGASPSPTKTAVSVSYKYLQTNN